MSYWNNYLGGRLSRRRALATVAAGAGAASFLAACGGGSNDDGPKGESGLISKATDSTSSAVPGGTMVQTSLQAQGWDPHTGARVVAIEQAGYCYSCLLRFKTGTPGKPPTGEVEADAATGWEVSPDGMQVTFKMRPNMKLDQRAPTNGRALDVQDVKFSWDRFAAVSASRGELINQFDPSAPVTTLTTPDAQTVVVKLAFPMAPILKLFAYHWYLAIMPVEVEGKFDPKNATRGSGPWQLDNYVPSQRIEYKRNPNYYLKDRPFFDGVTNIEQPEYASALPQFEAGNIWSYVLNPMDIMPMKRRRPELVLMREESFKPNPSYVISFSGQPQSPFRDQRMRQAVSMLIDRDEMVEFQKSPSIFEKEGLDVPTRWHSHFAAGLESLWLDPKGKEIGEGGKNFLKNVAEAKKLIAAAGYTDTEITLSQTNQTAERIRIGEIMTETMKQALKVKLNIVDQTTTYVPVYGATKDWEGMTIQAGKAEPDIDGYLASKYRPVGRSTYVTTPMPGISDLIDAQRKEFDVEKRTAMLKDIQKRMAVFMPAVPYEGATLGFNLYQPWLANVGANIDSGVHSAFAYDTLPTYWYDKSKHKNA